MNANPGNALHLWDVLEVLKADELPCGFYRIVYQLPVIDKIFLFKLKPLADKSSPTTGVPIAFSRDLILDLLESGVIRLSDYTLPWYMTVPENKLPENTKKRHEILWNAIRPLIKKDEYAAVTTDPELRRAAFARYSKQLGRPERYVARLMVRYWHWGGGRRSMVPMFENCGGRGKSRKSNLKLGRPRLVVLTGHDETRLGVNVTDDDKKLIEDITRRKIIGLHWQINRAHEYFMDQYKADTRVDLSGKVVSEPRSVHKIPDYTQFYYHQRKIRRHLDYQKLQAGRDWALKKRQLTSSAINGAFGPCDRFEIDATIANFWLVSRYDRHLIIGRPVVYMICDTWSRFKVGVHVALRGPSWNTARLAVCNAFLNKVPFLKSLGFEDVNDETWPAHDFCALIVSDQGEVLGHEAEHALQDGLGVDSRIVEPGRGDMKAIVERGFGTTDTRMSWIPGAYRARALEALKASNYDPRKDACADIVQFTRMLVEEILYSNDEEEHYELLTPQMRNSGLIRPTPRNLFLWGMENLVGREDPTNAHSRTPADIYRALLPYKDCVVTRQGLRFRQGQYFLSPTLLEQEYFAKQSMDDNKKKLRVFYEPFVMDAYIINEQSRQWEQVFLRDADRPRFGALTDEEAEDMLVTETLDRSDHADRKHRRRHKKTRRQQGWIDDAIRQQDEATKTNGRTLNGKNIKEGRRREAEIEDAKNAKAYANYGVTKTPKKASSNARLRVTTSKPRAHIINMMERLRKRSNRK